MIVCLICTLHQIDGIELFSTTSDTFCTRAMGKFKHNYFSPIYGGVTKTLPLGQYSQWVLFALFPSYDDTFFSLNNYNHWVKIFHFCTPWLLFSFYCCFFYQTDASITLMTFHTEYNITLHVLIINKRFIYSFLL